MHKRIRKTLSGRTLSGSQRDTPMSGALYDSAQQQPQVPGSTGADENNEFIHIEIQGDDDGEGPSSHTSTIGSSSNESFSSDEDHHYAAVLTGMSHDSSKRHLQQKPKSVRMLNADGSVADAGDAGTTNANTNDVDEGRAWFRRRVPQWVKRAQRGVLSAVSRTFFGEVPKESNSPHGSDDDESDDVEALLTDPTRVPTHRIVASQNFIPRLPTTQLTGGRSQNTPATNRLLHDIQRSRRTQSTLSGVFAGSGVYDQSGRMTADPFWVEGNLPELRDLDEEEEGEEEDVDDGGAAMDLIEAFHLYRRNPSEFYGIIVTAALSERDPIESPVTGEEMRETGGNPYLVTQVIHSGVLTSEPDAVLEAELHKYLDALVVPSPLCNGLLDPTSYEFLRCLAQVSSSTLSCPQCKLLRRSGFEFVMLLEEFPHLEQCARKEAAWYYSVRSALGTPLDFPLAILGLLLILFDLGCLALVGQHWYFHESSFGYITLLCYLGGYIVSLVAMVVLVRNRGESIVYEGRVTQFPSVNLKVFPLVPLYELVMFHAVVRHVFDRQKAHVAMKHDLYATFTVVRVLHSVVYSVPHCIVQSYLFDWGTLADESGDAVYVGYKLILISSLSCVLFAIILFARQLTVFDSINSMGFASFSTTAGSESDGTTIDDNASRLVHPSSVVPRTLTYCLFYLFEVSAFFLIISALNVDSCSTNTTVWMCFSAAIVLSCLIIFLASTYNSKSVFLASKWFVIPVALQSAVTIFMSVRKLGETEAIECRLFIRAGRVVTVTGYITWAMFGSLWLLWLITAQCCWRNVGQRDDQTGKEPIDQDEGGTPTQLTS